MSVGTIVVNEVVFRLVRVKLEGGQLILEATATGPVPRYQGGVTDIELFGRDGSACGSVRTRVPMWPAVHTCDTVTIEVPFVFKELIGRE